MLVLRSTLLSTRHTAPTPRATRTRRPAATSFETPPRTRTLAQLSRKLSRKLSTAALALILCFACAAEHAGARKRRAPGGGRTVVVVDERLAALRDAPDTGARLLQRLGRGRMVSVVGARRSADGVSFYQVAVTSRTRGWLQAESVVAPTRAGEDARLLRLIRGSEEFDRLARARIFLDNFPRSPLLPSVLLLYGEAAEEAAGKLSRQAARNLDEREMSAGGAPVHTYFMNYNALDRYNREGIRFVFNQRTKTFHYDGESWREILRRHPRSPEAAQARKRLEALSANVAP